MRERISHVVPSARARPERRSAVLTCALALATAALAGGCDLALCRDTPLEPPTATPRFAVRINAYPVAEPPNELPGVTPIVDPPGVGTAATIALYDENGALLHDRWLQSATSWEGASASLDAATELTARPGGLELTFANGSRSVTALSFSTGEAVEELLPYGSPPPAGGQLASVVRLDDGTTIAARARYEGGGGDVIWLDPAGGVRMSFDLAPLSSGDATPGELVALTGTRVMIGLHLPDEELAGAIAVLDVVSGAAARFDLPGYQQCTELASLGRDAATDTSRVAVLCSGDPSVAYERRDRTGIVLLEVTGGETPRVLAERFGGSLGGGVTPTGPLVALAGDWVAVLARGDIDVARPDRLIAVHLSSDATAELAEEDARPDDVWALGEGDFSPELGASGHILWPSARDGVLRFEQSDATESATFTALAASPLPDCAREPARLVRHLPPPP